MKFCNAPNCDTPVFSKGFCKSHQYMKPNFDGRSIVQKAIEKNKREKRAVRTLPHISEQEMEQLSSRNNLISELDFVFSRYIRIRDADANGIVKCYTCPKRGHWSLFDAAHYISRKHLMLRWESKNVKPNCKHCNQFLGGNLEVYRAELEKEEKGLPERLEEQSREVFQIGNDELSQLLIDLRSKLKIVESKLKIKSHAPNN